MTEWMQWVAVLGLIVISALTRSAFFITEQIWTMPKWLESGLRYAPIGALAAVAVPAVVMSRGGGIHLDWMTPQVVAAIAATVFAWWRKDMLLTIVVGMMVFHILRWVA